MPTKPKTATATPAGSASGSGLVVARYTCHVSAHVTIVEGSLWDAAHPVVVDNPDLFRDAWEVAIRE